MNDKFEAALSRLMKRFAKGQDLPYLQDLYFRQSFGRLLLCHQGVKIPDITIKLQAECGFSFTAKDCSQYKAFCRAFPYRKDLYAELSWSHYMFLVRIKKRRVRMFYARTAAREQWSLSELRRQVFTRLYERVLTPSTGSEQAEQAEGILRRAYSFEFTDLAADYSERDLEDALSARLRSFLHELGAGYAFVARQKHLTTDTGKHFYVDLVFYNYQQKRFVLFDLKIKELSYRDIGEMDLYVRLYDRKYRKPEDRPTIGVILCPKKDAALEELSVIADGDRIFAKVYHLGGG